jgi:hypothetical protein
LWEFGLWLCRATITYSRSVDRFGATPAQFDHIKPADLSPLI